MGLEQKAVKKKTDSKPYSVNNFQPQTAKRYHLAMIAYLSDGSPLPRPRAQIRNRHRTGY